MRKAPRQARSRATVDAIIEAGTRVLGRQGWAEFSTNGVAATAGVSIGSLYQYFPNKLSLIEAIRQRHFSEVLDVVRLASEHTGTLEEGIGVLVQGMLAVHRAFPALHRALLEEVPRSKELGAAHDEFERQYLGHYKLLIARHRRHDPQAADMSALVLSAAVEGVVHHAALRGGRDVRVLKQELVALACAYVAG